MASGSGDVGITAQNVNEDLFFEVMLGPLLQAVVLAAPLGVDFVARAPGAFRVTLGVVAEVTGLSITCAAITR